MLEIKVFGLIWSKGKAKNKTFIYYSFLLKKEELKKNFYNYAPFDLLDSLFIQRWRF